MPVFDWRYEPTRHFGRQPFPFARIAIQSRPGRWRTISLLVDTGAVISLLSRSAAELLEIDVESGRQISLIGVGQRENVVFVHQFKIRLGDLEPTSTRFAVSPGENVPNLLGRLDILDRFQMEFDPVARRTRIVTT